MFPCLFPFFFSGTEHVFHSECIDTWITKGRNACPACRATGVIKKGPSSEVDEGSEATAGVVPSMAAQVQAEERVERAQAEVAGVGLGPSGGGGGMGGSN